MNSRLPTGLLLVIALQWVAIVCLPPNMLAAMSPVLWVLIAALFAALGYYLYRRRGWARLATVFVQGFNIIVRLLVLIGNVVPESQSGAVQVNGWMLGSFVLSMILSAMILYYVDLPDVQMLMP